jgi:hypothetical protein
MKSQVTKVTRNNVVTVEGTVFHRRVKGKYDRFIIEIRSAYNNKIKRFTGKRVTVVVVSNDEQ